MLQEQKAHCWGHPWTCVTVPTWNNRKLRGPLSADTTLTHSLGIPAEPTHMGFTTHQCPEHIDGEEGDGEGDEPYSLQPAMQTEVVLGPSQAQPA